MSPDSGAATIVWPGKAVKVWPEVYKRQAIPRQDKHLDHLRETTMASLKKPKKKSGGIKRYVAAPGSLRAAVPAAVPGALDPRACHLFAAPNDSAEDGGGLSEPEPDEAPVAVRRHQGLKRRDSRGSSGPVVAATGSSSGLAEVGRA